MKYDSQIGLSVRKSIFFEQYRQVIDHILNCDDTRTLVCCSLEDDNTLFSFLVSQSNILHFAFTKESFRRLGIAKDLYRLSFADTTSIQFTHKTKYVTDLLRQKAHLIYNPFLLFKQGE